MMSSLLSDTIFFFGGFRFASSIAHASYESALSQQLKDAQIAVDRERAKQASKAKTLSPSDLLGLTEASLLARANSDGNTEPGAHQRRALFAVKRGARPFEFTPGDGASAPLKSGDDVDDDDYIASGMNELGVEECAARCASTYGLVAFWSPPQFCLLKSLITALLCLLRTHSSICHGVCSRCVAGPPTVPSTSACCAPPASAPTPTLLLLLLPQVEKQLDKKLVLSR